ncbi:MAG TPA: hypothetical protein GXX51_03970 [Firmicutes bacterium]|nr:hypothetical protein [Bacillota bacterium]
MEVLLYYIIEFITEDEITGDDFIVPGVRFLSSPLCFIEEVNASIQEMSASAGSLAEMAQNL